jgi:hypothetical protein
LIEKSLVFQKLDLLNEESHLLLAEFFLTLPHRDQSFMKSLVSKVKKKIKKKYIILKKFILFPLYKEFWKINLK